MIKSALILLMHGTDMKMVRINFHVESVNHNSVRRAKSNKQILEANCDDIIAVVVDTREFRRNGKSDKN
jgi:hypothetical protein